jgi:molecular chaperone DnaK (HSP70)
MFDHLTPAEWFRLLEECRERKEAIKPNSRKITLELDSVRTGWGATTIAVADFETRCLPLVEQTIEKTEQVLAQGGSQPLEALYVTGGGSELPLVGRMLRDRFGRRVKRSAYTRAATAIGLAIQADASSGYRLREQFGRNFGVWREAQGGAETVFDVIFEKGTPLPGAGEKPLTCERRYRPVHNIGHFRYFESSESASDGRPAGDIRNWDEAWFAFDPALVGAAQLDKLPVRYSMSAPSQSILERYTCDHNGAVTVTIRNETEGYEKTFPLARWSRPAGPLKAPARRKRS